MTTEQQEWTADDCDLGQLESYASINCRYYVKRLAQLTGRENAGEFAAHAKALVTWSRLRTALASESIELGYAKLVIKSIESFEPKPPDHKLLTEAQEDENEALWGEGIRTHEQVLAEQTRRESQTE